MRFDSRMRTLILEGAPHQMGVSYGRQLRAEIERFYAARIANAVQQAKEYGGRDVGEKELLAISTRCLPFVRAFSPEGYEELEGIGEGSGLGLLKIWTMNALTDLRDVAAYGDMALFRPVDGEGCSSFLVPKARGASGHGYVGQTWDLATDNLPHVLLVERRPTHAPRTISLTTDGCLSLIGMNELGIAIGTTNLRTTDARAGVSYLDIIHRALASVDLESAIAVVEGAPRAGAHYYYLMDQASRGVGIECAAQTARRIELGDRPYVHCNHALDEVVIALEARGTPVESSSFRQGRLAGLLDAKPKLADADLQAFLGDHAGGRNGICRHDFAGITSNGAMILCPGSMKAWAVHGPPCEGTWAEVPIGRGP